MPGSCFANGSTRVKLQDLRVTRCVQVIGREALLPALDVDGKSRKPMRVACHRTCLSVLDFVGNSNGEWCISQPALASSAPAPFLRRAFDWWLAQMKHALPPTIFFFIGFNLILFTKRLILQEHGVEFSGFLTATLAALLVGKAVLVTDNIPFMHRFDGAPMIQPILFKSAIYWLCVLVVRLAEGLVHFLSAGGLIADFPAHIVEHFSWARFLSIQIWLMVLFLVYVAIHELNKLFGDGELYRLFFRWRSSEAKLTRRQRIRLLTRLNRLTEANPIEAFSDRSSPAHAELIDILYRLSSPPVAAAARA